jgi:hypothetical protein
MAVHAQIIYEAVCDSCGYSFSIENGLVTHVDEFTRHGWRVEGNTVTCRKCQHGN